MFEEENETNFDIAYFVKPVSEEGEEEEKKEIVGEKRIERGDSGGLKDGPTTPGKIFHKHLSSIFLVIFSYKV